MKKNIWLSIGLIVAAAAAVAVFAGTSGKKETVEVASGSTMFVRADSQKLSTAADGKVTFVEFLDFECEACRAAHPAIEDLRKKYDGRVTFVVRNFPLHTNSLSAARAAEAAGAQGKFEEMYNKLFETQPQWGEQQTSQEEVFFALAKDMGLDMDKFMAVYNDPKTTQLVERDKADGLTVGVQGTPTFFLNEKKVVAESFEQLIEQFDAALAA
jgi:protein-disulfide isomerase